MKISLFLLLMISSSLAFGETVERAAARIEAMRAKVEKEEKARRQILSALYQINRQMRQQKTERGRLRIQLEGAKENLRKVETQLTGLEKTSAEMKMRLAERLRALHRMGGASVAQILFSSSSASQMDRNLKIMASLSARDRQAIVEYQKTLDEIEQRRNQMGQRVAQLQRLEAQLKSRDEKLQKDQALKSRLLRGVQRKHLFATNDLKRFKEQTRRAGFEDTSLLDALLRPSFYEQKGKLPGPIEKAVLSRRFGVEKAGENSWVLMHKGLRWSAPVGSSVRAVFDGVVSWVGQIGTSGKTVVVDHGDHYYTVYSEVENVRVVPGQEVRQLEPLAMVGRSVFEKSYGLHFEIRHFSEPDDPQPWMKGNIL